MSLSWVLCLKSLKIGGLEASLFATSIHPEFPMHCAYQRGTWEAFDLIRLITVN